MSAVYVGAKNEYKYRLEDYGWTDYQRSGSTRFDSELETSPEEVDHPITSTEAGELLRRVSKEALDNNVSSWLQTIHTGLNNRIFAEEAVAALYEHAGLARPVVIMCFSPPQAAMMPWLFFSVIRSEEWKSLHREMLRLPDFTRADFDRFWDVLWKKIGPSSIETMLSRSGFINKNPDSYSGIDDFLKSELFAAHQNNSLNRSFGTEQQTDEVYRDWRDFYEPALQEAESRTVSRCLEIFSLLRRANLDWPLWSVVEKGIRELELDTPRDANSVMGIFGGYAVLSEFERLKAVDYTYFAGVEVLFETLSDFIEKDVMSGFRAMLQMMRSCVDGIFLDRVVFLRGFPLKFEFEQIRDDYVLHSDNGPALLCADGFRRYLVHGVEVPSFVVEDPESITLATIDGEVNVEVRRIMLEKYGVSRFLMDSGAEIVDEDRFGTLYRRELPGDDPIVMVKLKNSTPEPDGSARTYFLRVPPETRSAREAVAWSFRLEEHDYDPVVET